MTTELDLIAAIRAAPDDDGPRLVYADWLLDRGDPRGEFIQLDCRMASLARYTDERRAAALHRSAIFQQHRDAWYGPVEAAGLGQAALYARGFLEQLVVRRPIAAGEVRAIAPVAREIDISGTDGPFDDLINEGGFDGFVVHAASLARLRGVPRLRVLRVTWEANQLGSLLDLPGLEHTERLALRAVPPVVLPPDEGRSLARALDGMKALRHLELDGLGIPRWPAWVERLTIRHVGRPDVAVSCSLESLRLEHLGLEDGDVRALVRSPAPRLHELALSTNLVGDEGARAIAGWDAPLLGIDLDTNPIGDPGVYALLARPSLRQLGVMGSGWKGPAPRGLIVLVEGRRGRDPRYFADENDEDLRPLNERTLSSDRRGAGNVYAELIVPPTSEMIDQWIVRFKPDRVPFVDDSERLLAAGPIEYRPRLASEQPTRRRQPALATVVGLGFAVTIALIIWYIFR